MALGHVRLIAFRLHSDGIPMAFPWVHQFGNGLSELMAVRPDYIASRFRE